MVVLALIILSCGSSQAGKITEPMSFLDQLMESFLQVFDRRYAPREEVEHHLRSIRRTLMSQQDQLDQLGQEIDDVATNLEQELSEVQTELDALSSQAPAELDFSGVQSKLDALSARVQTVGDLKPTPAADPGQPVDPSQPADPGQPADPSDA
jgi:septation ring formation regulator EzrA